MKTLEDIQGRCRIIDGHWLWSGALRQGGRASLYAPDYTQGGLRTQNGARAVWHCATGEPIPPGWRVYTVCKEKNCLNPSHIRCTPEADYWAHKVASGAFKGQTRRILANRAIGRSRSHLTPALIQEIQLSTETGTALAARLGLGRSVISKARRGQLRAFHAAGLFGSLMPPSDIPLDDPDADLDPLDEHDDTASFITLTAHPFAPAATCPA